MLGYESGFRGYGGIWVCSNLVVRSGVSLGGGGGFGVFFESGIHGGLRFWVCWDSRLGGMVSHVGGG